MEITDLWPASDNNAGSEGPRTGARFTDTGDIDELEAQVNLLASMIAAAEGRARHPSQSI